MVTRCTNVGVLTVLTEASSLYAYISLDELGEVSVPDVVHMRPLEQRHSTLIGLQTAYQNVKQHGECKTVDHITLKASSK